MKHLIKLIIPAVIFIPLNFFAQISQQWSSIYDSHMGQFDDIPSSLDVDESGNCYVTGRGGTQGSSNGFILLKYNSSGSLQWVIRDSAVYSGIRIKIKNNDEIYTLGVIQSGNINDLVTAKYNSAGVLLWKNVLDGTQNYQNAPLSLILDNFGNVIVSGSRGSPQNYDFLTAKYSSSGSLLWSVTFNSTESAIDIASDAAADISGNIYVTGYCTESDNKNFMTLKYDPAGTLIWSRYFNGDANFDDIARSVKIDLHGNIYVTGNSGGLTTMDDYRTIKYNSSGDVLWSKSYNGDAGLIDIPVSMVIDNNDNVIITGQSMGNGAYIDFATVKYNSSGSQFWVERFTGTTNAPDIPVSMIIDDFDDIYVTGKLGSESVTIKYNGTGNLKWTQLFGEGNNNIAVSSVLDSDKNIYVSGMNISGNANTNFLTIKYSQIVGIQTISGEIPNNFSLSQNYPNPFNPETTINFSIPSVETTRRVVSLKVYNISGKEVATLVNQQLTPGTYSANWDASNHPSGVYFYKVTAGEYTETKRMILMK